MERRTHRGIHFIRVKGDSIERAKAHAKLMRNEIPNGAIPYLSKKNEWLIRRAHGPLQFPPLQALVLQLYRKLVIPSMSSKMTEEEKQAIREVARISGMPYETWRETLFQADALMVLARTSMMKHLLHEWIPGALPGCTSAVTLGHWNQSGRVLVCRNFDYFVVGPWEKNATVVFNEPTESDQVPFVSLTSAGVQVGGVTAMNREGITLSTHAHFGREVSFRGRSIVLLGDEVIRTSKTLDQAISIIKKNPRCANWSFVMSSAKENRAIVIEMTPSKMNVREAEDGFIAHTNYFHSAELRNQEALLSGSYCEDLEGRFCQIRKNLEPHRGQLEPSHMSVALGDHRDFFTGEERVFGNTLSVVTTVNSVVFDPGEQKFWMAKRQESPVGLDDYIEVDVNQFWNRSADETEKSMKSLPHYQPKAPGLLEGIHHYREAYRAFHSDNHLPDYRERALEHLKKAFTAYPKDGHVWIQAGIVAFTLAQFTDAQTYFEKSLHLPLSPHVIAVRDLYLARSYDLLGLREKALQLYHAHPNVPEPKLKKAFKQGLKRPYRKSEIYSIQVDLQFPDTFNY